MVTPKPIPVHAGDWRELGEILVAAAKATPGDWTTRRIARGGALVAMRLRPPLNRWELCIGRDVAPRGLAERSRWEGEVRAIQRALGVTSWTRGDDAFNGDAIAATFTAPITSGDLQHSLDLTK